MTNPWNAVIGFPRWTGRATFAAGATAPDYPASNLGSLPLAQVWRSANTTTANTSIVATLDKPRGIQLLALVGHNLSLTATLRLRLYLEAARTTLVYDTGVIDAWPPVYAYETLAWEDDNWWDGRYTLEEIAGYRWTKPLWLDQQVLAQTAQIDITDTANSAGYVECGLCEISQGWQVATNFAPGAEYGFRFRSQSVEAIGGSKSFERRDKPRVFRGAIDYLPKEEAMARAFEHQRQMDLDEPFLWMPNPTDSQNLIRSCFLARNIDPGLMAYAVSSHHKVPLAFEEVL